MTTSVFSTIGNVEHSGGKPEQADAGISCHG